MAGVKEKKLRIAAKDPAMTTNHLVKSECRRCDTFKTSSQDSIAFDGQRHLFLTQGLQKGVVSASQRAGVLTLKASSSPVRNVRMLGSGELGGETKVVLRPWMAERVTHFAWSTMQELLSDRARKNEYQPSMISTHGRNIPLDKR